MKKIFTKSTAAIAALLLSTMPVLADEYNIIDQNEDPELHCLALNIYFESRGEPVLGQFAVADVTLNRVESPYFPNTICEVVYQRRQFSWTHQIPNPRNPRIRERGAWHDAQLYAIEIAEWDILRGITDDATYFHARYVSPRWRLRFENTATIGAHLFYRDPNRS